MQSIYEAIISINQDIFFAAILALLFSVEQIFFSANSLRERGPHLIGNVFLQLGYVVMNFGLATLVIKILDWAASERIGLFNIVAVPFYIQVIIGVLCIDLVNYWAHGLNHSSSLLWRLHIVHQAIQLWTVPQLTGFIH